MWLSQCWACWCSRLVPDSDNQAERDARRSVTVTLPFCSAKDGFTCYNFYAFFSKRIQQFAFIGSLEPETAGCWPLLLDFLRLFFIRSLSTASTFQQQLTLPKNKQLVRVKGFPNDKLYDKNSLISLCLHFGLFQTTAE